MITLSSKITPIRVTCCLDDRLTPVGIPHVRLGKVVPSAGFVRLDNARNAQAALEAANQAGPAGEAVGYFVFFKKKVCCFV